jgi:hypothetical protein
MVGGFPCESLLEFLQEVLLNFDSGDVAQAMSTKPWNQVFAQQERIRIHRIAVTKKDCGKYLGHVEAPVSGSRRVFVDDYAGGLSTGNHERAAKASGSN